MKELTINRKDLVWNKWNREHIKKHNLSPRQAEQVLDDQDKIIGKAYADSLKIIGKIGKRILALILNQEG